MTKDIFDRIAASAPLNSTAAKVTSPGSHYEPKFNPSRQTWDTPLPMKPVPPTAVQAKGIVGAKVGRLTVLGLFDNPNGDRLHKAKWVVRCVCGLYEMRSARAIRNPKNAGDCCQHCEAVQRHRENYQRLGSRAIEEFATQPAD